MFSSKSFSSGGAGRQKPDSLLKSFLYVAIGQRCADKVLKNCSSNMRETGIFEFNRAGAKSWI
jgi:hypothetical protein